jgi:chemotaxis signal transduction protein
MVDFQNTLTGLKSLEDKLDLLVKSFERILICKINDNLFGISVDEIDKIYEIDKKDFQSITNNEHDRYLKTNHSFFFNNEIVLMLDFKEEFINEVTV